MQTWNWALEPKDGELYKQYLYKCDPFLLKMPTSHIITSQIGWWRCEFESFLWRTQVNETLSVLPYF